MQNFVKLWAIFNESIILSKSKQEKICITVFQQRELIEWIKSIVELYVRPNNSFHNLLFYCFLTT